MRKRFIYLGFAAAAMLMGSCQAEKLGQGVSGEVDFTISTSIPSGLTTYADGEGSAASHLGGATNLDKTAYDLRYIMEVYTKDGDFVYRAVKTSDDFDGVSFEARLLAKEYDFVFWADFVKQGQTEDYIYDTDNLKSITVSDRRAGKDEADAYYAAKSVDMTASGQNLGQVVLKRPFGKIRMVATDELSAGAVGEAPTSAEITYGSDFKVPNTFNALEGKASGEMAAGLYSFEVYQEDAVVSGATKSGAYIIGYDYIFASDANTSYNFDVVISGASGQIGQRSLSSIPVQENKLTTIIGNFYTNETSLEVVVEDAFDGENTVNPGEPVGVSSVAELRNAVIKAKEGDVIVLSEGEYNLSAPVQTDPQGPNGYYLLINTKGLTLKGNGKVVIYTDDDAATGAWSLQNLVTVRAQNVTFDGITFVANYNTYYDGPNKTIEVYSNEGNNFTMRNCTLIGDENSEDAGCLYIGTDSGETTNATVENCTFINSAINVRTTTKATVKNCTFNGVRVRDGWNCSVSVRGEALVEECTFKNIQSDYEGTVLISNGAGRIVLLNNTFPTEDGTYWTVNESGSIVKASRTPLAGVNIEKDGLYYGYGESFVAALEAAQNGDVIVVTEGTYDLGKPGQFDAAGPEPYGYYLKIDKSITLKGLGNVEITTTHDANSGMGSLQNLITVNADNVIIENITFRGNYNSLYQGTNKIVLVQGNNATIKNCKFVPNTRAKDSSAAIYFAGSTVKTGTVTGCRIEKGCVSFDSIMGGNLTIEGNTFVEGTDNYAFTTPIWGKVDVPALAAAKTIFRVENNTFEGFEEYKEGANPAVRAAYGIFDLKNNNFPTDGKYWAAVVWDSNNTYGNRCDFGSIFVNYNSVIDQYWVKDRTEPKSFAISNDIVEFETETAPNNDWYSWQGRKTSVNMTEKSYWEVSATLTLTGENRNVRKSMWLNIGIDWPIVMFAQEDNTRSWKYWDSVGAGNWVTIDAKIPTTAGDYIIKTTFDNGTITHFINGTEVASYTLEETTSAVKEIIFNSYSFGDSYKTTWSYPVVK